MQLKQLQTETGFPLSLKILEAEFLEFQALESPLFQALQIL